MNKKIEDFFDNFGFQISLWLLIIGVLLIFVSALIKPFNDWSFNPDSQLFSNYGSFIGGLVGPLFTLAGFFLIFKTFKTQQDTLAQQEHSRLDQQKVFEQERFETTFFNLLNSQTLITNDLKAYFHSLKGLTNQVTNIVNGREFFIYSKVELTDIWNSLNNKKYSGFYDIETAEYKQIEIDDLYNPNSTSFTHPDDALQRENKIKYDLRLSQINKYYGIDGVLWDKFKKLETIDKIKLTYGLYFQKFHYAAGHYFRHLYHILSFIEKTEGKAQENSLKIKNISFKSYDYSNYASFLQSQMSSFELFLLFYNSFAFPKMLNLLKKYNLLENLAVEDLIDLSHDFDKEITLKKRKNLI